MVAVIKFGKSLRSTVRYNEKKITTGFAECIHSANYGKDTERLSPENRVARLEKQAMLNDRVKVNSVHITLNFDPSEKIGKAILRQIVDAYMKRIGYGRQPYIVYLHTDAGHPHVHIVSTNIRPDGTTIRSCNPMKYLWEPARQAIEQQFGLVRAREVKLRQPDQTRAIEPVKVQYGKTGTLHAITIVLDGILEKRQYTSLAELNAILRKYNVMADIGLEGSRIRRFGGLIYQALDDQGKRVGVPIKASDIYNKPTLKFLEKQFAKNASLRQTVPVPAVRETLPVPAVRETLPVPAVRETLPVPAVREITPSETRQTPKPKKMKRKRLHL
jgi:hypothetical protein